MLGKVDGADVEFGDLLVIFLLPDFIPFRFGPLLYKEPLLILLLLLLLLAPFTAEGASRRGPLTTGAD